MMLTHSPLSSSDPPQSVPPDPWEDLENPLPSHPWQIQMTPHPLLAPVRNREILLRAIEQPNLLRLKGLKMAPLEVLLQKTLKVKIERPSPLQTQLKNAFALLVWESEQRQHAIAQTPTL
jgi:hypothetical protein